VALTGKVTIHGTVIIPKKVPLILKPGSDITMEPNANILAYGGLVSIGTLDDPVRVHGNENGEAWGALAVVRSPEIVRLSHTEFQHGGEAVINGILFTGGFAVHDTDLELTDCRFINMQSEDALNLKNGTVLMRNTVFAANSSDGVDFDFVTGVVGDCKFIDNKGDGLDLSGSQVQISRSLFMNSGDKGISVGEDSHPVIINNLFRNNEIAISTKDLSTAKVASCTFVDNKLAIEAKRKKAMFGPGSGEFVNCVFAGNQTLLQEDYFSKNLVTFDQNISDDSLTQQHGKSVSMPIQFVAPEQQNYILSPAFAEKNGIGRALPQWYPAEIDHKEIAAPGIYSQIAEVKNPPY
jgi:hypothetical protein